MEKRLLVVDNDRKLLESICRLFEIHGYRVFSARSRSGALQVLRSERIHLALIDVRLHNDDDPSNSDSLTLGHNMLAAHGDVVRVFMTAYDDPDLRKAIHEPDDNGVVMGERLLLKTMHPKEWLTRIEALFSQRVPVNFDLSITSASDASLETCLSLLGEPELMHPLALPECVEEFKELLGRLFRRERGIQIHSMRQGLSSAALMRVDLALADGPGDPVVVKYGVRSDSQRPVIHREKRKSVAQEQANYERYVRNRTGQDSATRLDFFAQTPNLEGIVYSFLGSRPQALQTFAHYYESLQTDRVVRVVESLFSDVLSNWFETTVAPYPNSLGQFYLEHLNLHRPGQLDTAIESVQRALTVPEVATQVQVTFIDDQRLEIQIGQSEAGVYPNPMVYARERASRASAKVRQILCHGDLNASNMLIDDAGLPRLIDFAQTGPAPIYTDFAKLESVIRFELLRAPDLASLWALDNCLTTFFEPRSRFVDPGFKHAAGVVAAIRNQLQRRLIPGELDDYDIALLFHTLKRAGWPPTSSINDTDISAFGQVHAFFAAAQLAGKLAAETTSVAVTTPSAACRPPAPRQSVPAPDPLLIRRLREGRAGLFIGAGLSVGSGLPSWHSLFEPLLGELGLAGDGANFPDIAQRYVQQYEGRLPLVDHVIGALQQKTAQPNEHHNLLAQLPFGVIATTNYDELLEPVFPKPAFRHVFAEEEVSRSDLNRRIVLYLHGRVDAGWMIMTRDDFEAYERRHRRMRQLLQEWLQRYTFLFIGYSFRDPHWQKLLSHVAKIHRDLRQVHFAVLLNGVRDYKPDLEKLGVKAIHLSVEDPADPIELTDYLQQLVAALPPGTLTPPRG